MRLQAAVVGIIVAIGFSCAGAASAALRTPSPIPLRPNQYVPVLTATPAGSPGDPLGPGFGGAGWSAYARSPAMGFTYRSSVLGQLAGSAAVMGVGFLLNSTIQPGKGQDTVVDDVGTILGSPYVLLGGTGLYATYGLATDRQEVLDTSEDLALSLGATYATVWLLKVAVPEERPDGSDDNSFPSGHAAGSFAVATVLDRQYGGAVGWIAYGTAAFITATRLYGDHHWLKDIVAGAVIGHFYGWLFTREN